MNAMCGSRSELGMLGPLEKSRGGGAPLFRTAPYQQSAQQSADLGESQSKEM
jgi:hypothetical protein